MTRHTIKALSDTLLKCVGRCKTAPFSVTGMNLIASSFVLFFAFAPYAFAQGFVPLAPIPGLTDVPPTSGGLATFFNNLYKYMIGLAAALAVIMITWAGLKIAMNRDNVSTIMDSKGTIYNAVFGLVLVLSPYLVFSIINPSILNLSFNLPKLDTSAAPPITVGPTYTSLSETVIEDRQSLGGKVLYALIVDPTKLTTSTVKYLESEQDRCMAYPGGPGIILPENLAGASYGGSTRYVCQTCPPNTKAVPLPKGRLDARVFGTCEPIPI